MGKTALFISISAYLTEVVAFCNFFMLITVSQSGDLATIELWPWLCLALVSFVALHLFLRQERTVVQVAVVTGICTIIALAVMSLWFIRVTGWAAWGFAWAFIGASIIRSGFISVAPYQTAGIMLHCELPAMGIACLLWFQEGGVFSMPTYYTVCSLAALFLSVLALTLIRIQSAGGGQVKQSSAVATVAVSLGALGALAVAIGSIAASLASTTVTKTTSLITWIWNMFWGILAAIWNWWLSLFPPQEVEPYELEVESVEVAGEFAESTALSEGVVQAMIIIAVALVVAAVLMVLFRLRKVKLSRLKGHMVYSRPTQTMEKIKLWARLKAFFRRRYEALAFALRLIAKRNTPQGAALVLANIGKQRGVSKGMGESYHSYLHRLSSLCQQEESQQLLCQLATTLDDVLYGAESAPRVFTGAQYSAMRKAVGQIGHKSRAKMA